MSPIQDFLSSTFPPHNHSLVVEAASGCFSNNIGIQLFEYAFLRMFCAVHEADAHLRTKRYELIPARQLLTVLQKTPHSLEGADIEISEEDRVVYQLLKGKTSQMIGSLKYINSRKAEECADVYSGVVGQK